MYLNRHEGNSDSFQTGHQSWKLKHNCSRCSKSFQFAFQLRSHLRCHLLKTPSAYVHDMKDTQNLSASQFRLLKDEMIEHDNEYLSFSNQEGLSSGKNSFGVNSDLYIDNSESDLVRSKSECGTSGFTGIQNRKRKSGQTLAEICGKLQKSRSLKNVCTPLYTSAVSSDIFTNNSEEPIENPLESNDFESCSSQNVTQNECLQLSTNAVENVLEKETSDVAQKRNFTEKPFAAQQGDSVFRAFTPTSATEKTASSPQNIKCTDSVTGQGDALRFDKQENTPQKNPISSTNLQERVHLENLCKSSQKQVTLGDMTSAEQVLPLAESSEIKESLASQSVNTKGFTCSTCGSSYSRNSGLALHLLAHKRREMVVKFRKKDQSKTVMKGNISSGVITVTSKEAQSNVPDSEFSTKESVSITRNLRSDMSKENSINKVVLTKSKSISSPTSSVLNTVLKTYFSSKNECNLTDSESENSVTKTGGNSKDALNEPKAIQSGGDSACSEMAYTSVSRVCETECPTNVFKNQSSSASTSKTSSNFVNVCSTTTTFDEKGDFMEDSALAQCPQTGSDLAQEHSILQKTKESLDKQMNLTIDEKVIGKQNKTIRSCYKKKMEVMPCQYCYTLVSKRNMSRHRSIHCPVLTLPCYTKAKCHVCSMSLHSQELARHLEVVHGQGVMRMRSCNVCFRDGFESFVSLQEHKKEHFLGIRDIDLRPSELYDRNLPGCGHLCPICNTETLSASNIRSHIVSHMLDKDCNRNQLRKGEKFGCPVCLKSFELNSRIENHILSHWKIRLYECPSCLKQFTRYDAMERHCVKKHKPNATSVLSDAPGSLELPKYTTKTEAITADDQ